MGGVGHHHRRHHTAPSGPTPGRWCLEGPGRSWGAKRRRRTRAWASLPRSWGICPPRQILGIGCPLVPVFVPPVSRCCSRARTPRAGHGAATHQAARASQRTDSSAPSSRVNPMIDNHHRDGEGQSRYRSSPTIPKPQFRDRATRDIGDADRNKEPDHQNCSSAPHRCLPSIRQAPGYLPLNCENVEAHAAAWLPTRRAERQRRSTHNQHPSQVRQPRLPSMRPPHPRIAASNWTVALPPTAAPLPPPFFPSSPRLVTPMT
jgi:hypothetical protein